MTTAVSPNVVLDKDYPTSEWIADLRGRLPAEPEIDRILTRKLERRSAGSFTWPTADEIEAGLRSLLSAELADRFHEMRNIKWLSGGASKIQVYFELSWTQSDGTVTQTPMVLRMDSAASIQETSRRREFELLSTFKGVVPIPTAYWLDDSAEHLPYPALISGFVPGVAKPTSTGRVVSGLGTTFSPDLRSALGQQFIRHLAAIHNHDIADPGFQSFGRPANPKEVVALNINAWERVWEEDSDLDIPLLRLGLAWLRHNIPKVDRLSVVHADYRTGNYLFTEEDARISAILDWEGGHIGDRHEDLAYAVNRMFGSFGEHGTFLVSGLMPEQQFFDSYSEASGLPVDPDALQFWKVFNCVKTVVVAVGSGTCDFEVDFRGVMPAWDVHDPADNPMIAAGDTGLGDAWANGHYDLIGNVTGRLNLRGKTYDIDCYAGMDHSWGPRVELGTTAVTYLHVLFGDDYGLHLVLSLDIIDGQVIYGPFRFGYVVDGGEVFGITDATMSASHIGMLPATNHIRATDVRGKVHEFLGTAVGGAPWHSFIPAYVSYQSLMRYQLGDRVGYAMQADCFGLEFLAERMSRHGVGAKRA